MKKAVSIVLAIALVLSMLPSFAVASGMTSGEKLQMYNYIAGNANGDLNEEGLLTRAELAVIIASIRNESDAAAAVVPNNEFTDVANDAWYAPYVGYVKAKGLMSGTSEGTFAPGAKVSSKQAAVVILAALGYAADQDYFWASVEQDLLRLTGIPIVSVSEIKRGDLFDALWLAVSTPVMKQAVNESTILGVLTGKLSADEFGSGQQGSQAGELKVQSVKASNLKEVFVTFNQSVANDSLGTYVVKKKSDGANTTIVMIEKHSDNIVKLTMWEALEDSTNYVLTVEEATSSDGDSALPTKTEVEFIAQDLERPELERVAVAGSEDIRLIFNEPIKSAGTVKVRRETGVVGSALPEVNGRAVNVHLNSAMQEGETYTVEVSSFTDYANMENIPMAVTFPYEPDMVAPTLEVVEATQEYVVVAFSEPVKGLKKDYFHHSFASYDPQEILTVEANPRSITENMVVSKTKLVFYKAGAGNGLPSGSVTFMWEGEKIDDLSGNKLGDGSTTIEVAVLDEKPAVEEVNLLSNHKLEVIFTKGVTPIGNKKESFIVRNENGNRITEDITEITDKKWEVSFAPQESGKKIGLTVKNLEDKSINNNKIQRYRENLTIADNEGPTVKSVSFVPGSGYGTPNEVMGRLYVSFSEAIAGGALDKANYKTTTDDGDGSYLSLQNDGSFLDDELKVVVFNLEQSENDRFNTGSYQLLVSGVKDKAGNEVVSVLTEIVKQAEDQQNQENQPKE